jgi:hypothetical protein
MAEQQNYTYKNTSDKPLQIMGVPGDLEPGAEFTTDHEVNNANLELVKSKTEKTSKKASE